MPTAVPNMAGCDEGRPARSRAGRVGSAVVEDQSKRNSFLVIAIRT